MRSGEAIAAVASAPGRSARALLRLSGPDLTPVCAVLLTPPPTNRGAVVSRFRLENDRRLSVLCAFFPAPGSYTGEDVVEIQLPGNPALAERALRAATRLEGVRHAEPGEFTARAFFNGELTVEQAEGVAFTIAAHSNEQLSAARRLAEGETGERHRRLSDGIAEALALVEAGIDFSDQEDVVAIEAGELRRRAGALLDEIDDLLGPAAGGEQHEGEPRVVLAGPPNAGKSTLFNALLGFDRAVVNERAGTTRDALAERLDLSRDLPGAGEATLLDLAGLDAALSGGVVDAEAQRAARREVEQADAIVLCDPAGRFEPPGAIDPNAAVVRVRTKADLPGSEEVDAEADALQVCALDGWNLAALRRAIADAVESSRAGAELRVLPRHRRALERTRESLVTAKEVAESADARGGVASAELTAQSLREALDAIGEIAGRVHPDDVIGRIFATFCVGK